MLDVTMGTVRFCQRGRYVFVNFCDNGDGTFLSTFA